MTTTEGLCEQIRPVVNNNAYSSEELARLKGQFLASLNHEIRTPLSGILGMTDLLLETRLDEEQKEYTTAAHLCAESLLDLLNGALEFSALSAGTPVVEEHAFNLPETLMAAVDPHLLKAQAKGLELHCVLDEGLPDVAAGDAVRLRQVLSRLIDNAVKFTPAGRVEVRGVAEPPAGDTFLLRVEILDTGIGIPVDRLAAVFESFHQLESGLSRTYSGLGLGLAIAQKLTLLMNGEIFAESETGKGSCFTVKIPLHISGESAELSPRFPATVSSSAHQARVLVVDDNDVAQRIAEHILRRGRYEPSCVSSGEEAIAEASRSAYDLILLDLQMPVMDGFETAARIRQLPGYSHIPVVALTANTSEECRAHCFRKGLQGFLEKPVQERELLALLAQTLS